MINNRFQFTIILIVFIFLLGHFKTSAQCNYTVVKGIDTLFVSKYSCNVILDWQEPTFEPSGVATDGSPCNFMSANLVSIEDINSLITYSKGDSIPFVDCGISPSIKITYNVIIGGTMFPVDFYPIYANTVPPVATPTGSILNFATLNVSCDNPVVDNINPITGNMYYDFDFNNQCSATPLDHFYQDEISYGVGCLTIYRITRTWYVFDECGNLFSYPQIINVSADAPPESDADNDNPIIIDCANEDAIATIQNWSENFINVYWCNNSPAIQGAVTRTNDFDPTAYQGNCLSGDTIHVNYYINYECSFSFTYPNDTIPVTFIITDTSAPTFATAPTVGTYGCNPGVAVMDDFKAWLKTFGQSSQYDSNIAYVKDQCATNQDLSVVYKVDGVPMDTNALVVLFETMLNDATCEDMVNIDGFDYPYVKAHLKVTFEVSDPCGNIVADSATFYVSDSDAPMITNPAADSLMQCLGVSANRAALQIWLDNHGGATADDPCYDVDNITWKAYLSGTNTLATVNDLPDTCAYALPIDFVAEDNCGNISNISTASFNVIDEVQPTWTVDPDSLVLECGDPNNPALVQAWINNHGGGSATDICSDVIYTTNYNNMLPSKGCGNASRKNVLFGSSDACGNILPKSTKLVLKDNTEPTWTTLPQNTTISGANVQTQLDTWLNNHGGGIATDLCSTTLSYTNTPVVLTAQCTQTHTVTFSVTDECLHTATATATVTVLSDTTPPTWTTLPSDISVSCAMNTNVAAVVQTWLNSYASGVATDLTGVTYSYDSTLVASCGVAGLVNTMFMATDGCGNTSTASAVATITDNIAPVISNNSFVKIFNCSAPNVTDSINIWLANHGNLIASDCNTVTWTNNFTGLSDDCGNTGNAFVTFTATDACNNTTTAAISLSITDNSGPIWTTNPQGIAVQCDDPLKQQKFENWILAHGNGLATDACSNVVTYPTIDYTIIPADGDPETFDNFQIGIDPYPVIPDGCDWKIRVYFWAQDECSKVTRSPNFATFNINDTIAPSIVNFPNDVTIQCGMVIPSAPTLTATDNCDNAPTVSNVEQSSSVGVCPVKEIITRTWTASDACSNQTVKTQTITIIDTAAPTISNVPNDVTVTCSTVPPNPQNVVAGDACGAVQFSVNDISTQLASLDSCLHYNYNIKRIWQATDACGNIAKDTQLIQVIDNLAPSFVVPADTTVTCSLATNPNAAGLPTAVSDNCMASPYVNHSDQIVGSGTCQNYTINRTWIVSDACGNATSAIQVISVIDTIEPSITTQAQNITLYCTDNINVDSLFIVWVNNHGNAVAADDCSNASSLTWYALQPNSYDINNVSTFVNTMSGFGPAVCPSANGAYRSQTVDFIAVDGCGNALMTSATFELLDTIAPIMNNCPTSATIVSSPGLCQANYDLPIPLITDACGSINQTVNITTPDMPIISSSPGSETVVVDSMTLSFSVPTLPVIATGGVQLRIRMFLTDTEQPGEYFEIYAEDGSYLGKTKKSLTQCDTVTITTINNITTDQINNWAADGMMTFKLIPNIPSNGTIYAINDICPGAFVNAVLKYETTSNYVGLNYTVNNGSANPLALVGTTTAPLNVGTNVVTYVASDCAGNTTSCSFTMTVTDNGVPSIACPSDVVVQSAPDSCAATLTLPLPAGIADDCGAPANFIQTQPTTIDSLLTFTFNPNYLEYIANDKTITFANVAANAVGSEVNLSVSIKGDVNNPEEYFSIYGENNTFLGTTEVGQSNVSNGNCDTASITNIVIPANLFNQWAVDGNLVITAIANKSFIGGPPGGSEDGINPCVAFASNTPDGTTDSVSVIKMTLTYADADPYYATSGATITPLTLMQKPAIAPTVTFNTGITTVVYQVTDAVGNTGSCTFNVTVQDLVQPTAVCAATTIMVNPSGITPTTLDPALIDAGSSDNCGSVSIAVSPSIYNCNMIGDTLTATLTVTDLAGNTSQCTALVKVDGEAPIPSYNLGLCGNDTLHLFANPPVAQGNIVYTYEWNGPNGYVSFEQNPIIPGVSVSNAGAYSVKVFGITGCFASGSVYVFISPQPNTPVLSATPIACEGQTLTLQTQAYTGANPIYNWYNGTSPNGTLLATSSTPQLPLNYGVGNYEFYVQVSVAGCESNYSASVPVSVLSAPIAAVNNAVIDVCQGETVALGTPTTSSGYTYQWIGPNGYSSNLQNPPVIANATTANSGTYYLTVFNNGCPSNQVNSVVNVTAQPPTPLIAGTSVICTGGTLTLVSNINGSGYLYTWTSPSFLPFTTASNTLSIPNAFDGYSGNWTLSISKDNCTSNTSSPYNVTVQPPLTVVASNNGPVCAGKPVTISSTGIIGASYSWTGPNNFTSQIPNPVINPAVAGTYNVVVTNANGCIGTGSTTVTINTAPTVVTTSDNGGNCVNGSTNISIFPTIFPVDANNNYSYSWTGPNGAFFSNNANPTIPLATENNNGAYTLVVTNAQGCVSSPYTHVLDVHNIPATPSITIADNLICQGEVLSISCTPYIGTGIEYIWTTPLGTQTTTVPSLTINNATANSTGNYSVAVKVNGCISSPSGVKVATIIATPATPVANSNSPVCAGSPLQLSTNFIAGATYEWVGPNFSSSLGSPVLPNATELNEGCYKVRIITPQGCSSLFSTDECVVVNPIPVTPIALNNGPVCIDAPDAAAVLSVSASTAVNGASYTWYNASDNAVLGESTLALTYPYSDLTSYNEGTYNFYVVTTASGCNSLPSVNTSVVFNTIPNNTAFAGVDTAICGTTTVTLNASVPTIGYGTWSIVSGASIISNPQAANTTVNGLSSGNNYLYQWTISNGACINYSSDTVMVVVNGAAAQAEAGAAISQCEANTVTLNGNAPILGVTATWTQPATQAQLGVTIDSPNDPNTSVSGLTPGNTYIFTWKYENPGCNDFSSDNVTVTIDAKADGAPYAGEDFSACGEGNVILNAATPNIGSGYWSSPDEEITFVTPENPVSIVLDLKGGENTLIWTLSNGACVDYASDTLIINFEDMPIAVPDVVSVAFGGSAIVPVANNDQLPNDYTITIATPAAHGEASVMANGQVFYIPNSAYAGTDEFIYQVCNDLCPDICVTAKVTVNVGENADCIAPTIITPNNDGMNDAFIVPCIATGKYPNNSVIIFNQWGDEVYRGAPYQNDWIGTFNGEELPAGTYYFIVDFGDNQEPQIGFLVIER